MTHQPARPHDRLPRRDATAIASGRRISVKLGRDLLAQGTPQDELLQRAYGLSPRASAPVLPALTPWSLALALGSVRGR